MKLLHLDSSILYEKSVSRMVGAAVVSRLQQIRPDLEVIYRDLIAAPLPHLTLSHLPQNYPLASGAAVQEATAENLAISQAVLTEFLETDIVVIGTPMYNFTIPTQLKAWIDRIIITGRTFRYTAEGAVEGLAADKRVIIALSRGGFYGPGTPSVASEHSETYLRAIFSFIGINPEFIIAEGIQMGPEYRKKAIESALAAVTGLGAA